jgi:hypothetical protein
MQENQDKKQVRTKYNHSKREYKKIFPAGMNICVLPFVQ